MERHTLSKSSFIRGVQCLKSLYLYKHRYFLRDPLPIEQRAKFSRGTAVGVLARELYPGGINVAPKTPFQYPQSVQKTLDLISEGVAVIYEACFIYDGVLVAIDILLKTGDSWKAIEVKSSAGLSDTYLADAALQYYVISNSGINLRSISLVHIDPQYVREENLDIKALFRETDVTDYAVAQSDFIRQKIEEEKQVLGLKNSPSVPIGSHCHHPYPCDFIGHCWKKVPRNSIFALSDLGEDLIWDYHKTGLTVPAEVPVNGLSVVQLIQLEAHRDEKDYLDANALREWYSQLKFPAMLLKINTTRPAVPIFKGMKPYQVLPYMAGFSMVDENGKETAPYQQIVFSGEEDQYPAFLEEMTANFTNTGSIIVFGDNSLKEPGKFFPGHSFQLPPVYDLRDVFTAKFYYPWKILGDYSLGIITDALGIPGSKADIPSGTDTLMNLAWNEYSSNQQAEGLKKLTAYGEAWNSGIKNVMRDLAELVAAD